MSTPDLSVLRARFPALAREHDGRPAVFLDAPGGSQVPETVIQAMATYLRSSNANAHGAFATSQETDRTIADVTLDLASFEEALSERTKVVAVTLASNAVGTITPAADLARIVHERTPAIVVFDGVHLAQHRSIDVRALGADLLAVSPYKIFGPHLGILFGRRELLRSLTPYKVRPASDDLPDRFETGTQNHEGFAGWTAAVEYLAEVGRTHGAPAGPHRRDAVAAAFGAFAAWEHHLAARFLEGARSVPGLRVYGIADPECLADRTPTFAVRLGDRHPLEIAKALGARGIFVWDGHYYALELMERLGLQETGGAVRIGFCHYNTPAEADRVLEELSGLA